MFEMSEIIMMGSLIAGPVGAVTFLYRTFATREEFNDGIDDLRKDIFQVREDIRAFRSDLTRERRK